ncbi:twin-arginine translocation signal domain-containing protein [Candidatus Nanohalovita haloferacivicina]|uniref:twin-arginine translocation signal domain-containing protein n=1 Tax=Candidatus Nanohalovita haloferacivicina TaxID=2978046 RepID=UPI00325FAD1E|nr:hypothetical protein HBNXNv_1098 [Candidatus Nanohalobia archaeon BNXNv]
MSIGDRIGNWVDRQVDDARDIFSFSYENLRGNTPPSPGRRQFLKATGAAATGGGVVGYGVSEYLEGGDTGQSPQDDGQSGGQSGDGSGGGSNGGSTGGSSGGQSGSSNGGSSGNGSGSDVESINQILGDNGDTDIETVIDWYGEGHDRGYSADDIASAYNSDQDEYELAFYDGSDGELPLVLTEDQGFSDSEVNKILEYENEGKLAESFRKMEN